MRHPNVVQVLNVVTEQEIILVMEYVQGIALSKLMETARRTGTPARAAGLVSVLNVVIAANANSYAYTYQEAFSRLYVAEWL